jgi:NAD(P)-dependent dehydrogenase (short-subunit alcohol dehydrogenase family)
VRRSPQLPTHFTRSVRCCGSANRGLGLGLTRSYLRDGFKVIATTRAALNTESASELAVLATEHKQQLRVEVCDVADWRQVSGLFERLAVDTPTIDILINNAGLLHGGTINDVTEEQLQACFAVNASAPLHVAQAAEKLVKAGREPKFVTISRCARAHWPASGMLRQSLCPSGRTFCGCCIIRTRAVARYGHIAQRGLSPGLRGLFRSPSLRVSVCDRTSARAPLARPPLL